MLVLLKKTYLSVTRNWLQNTTQGIKKHLLPCAVGGLIGLGLSFPMYILTPQQTLAAVQSLLACAQKIHPLVAISWFFPCLAALHIISLQTEIEKTNKNSSSETTDDKKIILCKSNCLMILGITVMGIAMLLLKF